MAAPASFSFSGIHVVLTRPVGQATAWARSVRNNGGRPVLLPGLSLHRVSDEALAREALLQALAADVLLFTSPAAVRHAAALAPLRTDAYVCSVGPGTARALHRHGVATVAVPARQDSEGVLALPGLQALSDLNVALVGAAGGRGLLRQALTQRAHHFVEVHVYRRGAARLSSKHIAAVRALDADDIVLLSSGEALDNLHAGLPADAWQRLQACRLVVSSERLRELAAAAGFRRIAVAPAAGRDDMLAAALHERSC